MKLPMFNDIRELNFYLQSRFRNIFARDEFHHKVRIEVGDFYSPSLHYQLQEIRDRIPAFLEVSVKWTVGQSYRDWTVLKGLYSEHSGAFDPYFRNPPNFHEPVPPPVKIIPPHECQKNRVEMIYSSFCKVCDKDLK